MDPVPLEILKRLADESRRDADFLASAQARAHAAIDSIRRKRRNLEDPVALAQRVTNTASEKRTKARRLVAESKAELRSLMKVIAAAEKAGLTQRARAAARKLAKSAASEMPSLERRIASLQMKADAAAEKWRIARSDLKAAKDERRRKDAVLAKELRTAEEELQEVLGEVPRAEAKWKVAVQKYEIAKGRR